MRSKLLFTLCVGMLLSACGSDSSDSTPTTPSGATSTFQGTVAGKAGQSGTLSITVQAQVAQSAVPFFRWPFVETLHAQGSTIPATGSLHLAGGATIALTGTYDSSTKALNLSGDGFTFTGSVNGAAITGTYSGPSGVTGTFSSRNTATGTVAVYCGNIFSSGNASDITGVFNLVVSEGTGAVSGAFYLTFEPFNNGQITGQVTGTAFSLTYTDRVSGQSGTATGTIQGGSVSGSAPASSGGSNPFSGSINRCQ